MAIFFNGFCHFTLVSLLLFQSLSAATYLWQGTAVSESLTTAANWSPNGVPVSGDQAQFDSSTTGLAPTANSAFTLDLMTFTSVVGADPYSFAITGAPLTFAGSALTPSGVQVLSGVNQTFNANQNGSIVFQNSSSADVGNTGLVTYNIGSNAGPSSGQITFSNSSSAGAAQINLVRSSAATFTNTANGTTGTTFNLNTSSQIVSDHSVMLGAVTMVDTLSQLKVGGTASIGSSGTQTIAGIIADNGLPCRLRKIGTGTVNLTSTSLTYSGGTHVSQGTLLFTNTLPPTSGTALIDSGAILEIERTTGTATYQNQITGAGNVVVNALGGNTGTLILSGLFGNGNYSGGTEIGGGILRIDNQASMSLTGPISVNSGATLDLEQIPGTSGSYGGPITGAGNLIINQVAGRTGNVILSGLTGNTNYTGTTTVNGGQLVFNTSSISPTALTGGIAVGSTAVVDFEQAANTISTYSGAVTGLGNVFINQTSGNSGTVVLAQPQYTGSTSIGGGILQVNAIPTASGIFLSNNGTINFNTAGVYGNNITGIGNLIAAPGLLDTLTLTGLSGVAYTGSTAVNSGTLIFQNSAPTTTLGGNIFLNGSMVNPVNVQFEQAPGTVGNYNGNITGNGSAVVNAIPGNTGTTVFSGLNSYTGGTTVTAGTLQGNSASLQGAIANNGILTFNQIDDGAFNGAITGPMMSVLNKTGPGVLLVNTNQSGFLGNTFIQEGALALTSALGGNVFVQGAGVLAGNGILLGNVTVGNGGIVSPGLSIGTLTVNGNYVQNPGSIYTVQVIGEQNSAINVLGTAALNSGAAVYVTPSGAPNLDGPYVILTANGGLSGTFSSVTSSNPLYVPTVVYDPTHAFLFLQLQFTLLAATSNQERVAEQLQSITRPTPEEEAILQQLVLLSEFDAQHALDQMSGQQYTSLLLTAEIANRQFIRRLFDPLRSAIATDPCQTCCVVVDQLPLEMWGTLSGGKTFFEGNRNTRGLRMSDYELTFGAQAALPWNLTLGTAACLEVDHISYRVGGSGKSHLGLAAVYGLYRPANYYLLGDLVFGYRHESMQRPINVGTISLRARSRPRIYHGTTYLEAGYDRMCGCMLIQPFIGLEVGYYGFNHIKEHGAHPLNLFVSSRSRAIAYSRLGLHFTTPELLCGFSMGADLAWQYRFTSQGNVITEQFNDFGESFSIRGFHLQRNSVEAAVRIFQEFCDGWEFFAEMAGQSWQSAFSYTFIGGVKATW